MDTKKESAVTSLAEKARTWISRLPSFSHAVYFFVAVTLSLVFAKRFILDHDPNKCQALVQSGHWRGDWRGDSWLAPGCSAISHGGVDMDRCTNGHERRIVFAGDLQTQGIYYSMVHRLDKDFDIPSLEKKNKEYSKNKIHLEFIYDPFLNGSKVVHRAEEMRDGKDVTPMLTVFGAGQWFVENDAEEEYIKTVEHLADTAYSSGRLPRVPVGSDEVFTDKDGPGDLLLFTPVQTPRIDSKSEKPDFAAYDHINSLLHQVEHVSVMWSFADMTANKRDAYMDDGVHVKQKLSDKRAELLLNLRCNASRGRRGNFPNLAICCGAWRSPNWQQMTFLILGLAVLPALVLLDSRLPILSDNSRSVVRGFCAFMAVVSFQWISDRTHIFEQTTRFSLRWPNLRNMLLVTLLVGAVSVRRSPAPRRPANHDKAPDHPFLPRDQSNEWKGWMQLLIIIYHYNEAYALPWYWYIIRLCVSSYLFMTGFGHTIYFLQKNDFSAKRFVNVMIRTNLLPVALAYVQRTRWLLYYYMPLSTFWFCVVYVTLAVRSQWNRYIPFVLAKITLSAAMVHIFISTKDLPETVVRFFEITFKMSFDAKEFFHHRVDMDQYIVYVGMFAAVIYIQIKDLLDANKRKDTFSKGFRVLWPGFKWCAVLGCGCGIGYFFWYINHKFDGTSTWSHWQPYITFIPILTFAVLRNAHPVLRNWHSVAFAFLGKYSGEMYVMQDHLWLAGDQEAVLRTGLFHGDDTLMGDRWRDLIFTTPLYLVGCMIIGDATGVIAEWFVKVEEKKPLAAVEGHRTPISEMEMGLLTGDGESDEADTMNEKARPTSKWQVWSHRIERTQNAIQEVVWPDRVRDRAVLALLGLWILNLTYT